MQHTAFPCIRLKRDAQKTLPGKAAGDIPDMLVHSENLRNNDDNRVFPGNCGPGRINGNLEIIERTPAPFVTMMPSLEVVMTSPATDSAAIAKPARPMPAALIRARNCLRDIPSYAFDSQFSPMSTSFLTIKGIETDAFQSGGCHAGRNDSVNSLHK